MSADPAQLKEQVARALAEVVAPALGMEADGLEVLDVNDGVARVRLRGACGGCPSSIMAVIMGVEQELQRLVPGVEYLEVVP